METQAEGIVRHVEERGRVVKSVRAIADGADRYRKLIDRLSGVDGPSETEAAQEAAGDASDSDTPTAAPKKHALSDLVVVGRAGGKQLDEIQASCLPGERPEFIIGSGPAGSLAGFKDRCIIVKKGGLTSFMAGATGGGRTATFHYVDVTAIEYNAGFVNGVLEILTASHDAGRAKDYWKMSGTGGGGNSAWELPNTLPLPKADYNKARSHIEKLREMVAAAKRPAAPLTEQATDIVDQLARLKELHDQGALDNDEFKAAKERVLGRSGSAEP